MKDNIQATFCSTGQQKQIILSILLCQCHYIISNFNTSPIVLFDEICSHLDEKTRQVLLHLTDWLKTQVFITGTNKESNWFGTETITVYVSDPYGGEDSQEVEVEVKVEVDVTPAGPRSAGTTIDAPAHSFRALARRRQGLH